MENKVQSSNFKFQNKIKSISYLYVFLLTLFILPGIIGLVHSGFPSTDDGGWMIIRFSAFYEALRHGQFPVRFLMRLNHGYGYPVADFLYPLFMYLGVPIHILGINFINTIKIILGGSLLLSGLFTFFWLRKLFHNLPAFIGAVCYALFPYHLYDMYQRGSVGEVLALAIVPFIFWQIEKKNFALTSLGMGLLILSHNTLALLFLPVVLSYLVIKRTFAIKTLIFSVIVSLGFAAFFWLPALYDKQFTIFDTVKVSNISQYFLTTKNFGILGVLGLTLSIIGINLVFKRAKNHDIFFLGVLYVGLFFALPISSFVWKLIPLPQLIQFPFRFLSLVLLGTSFLLAFFLEKMRSSLRIPIAGLCLFLIYVTGWMYMSPTTYLGYPDSYYATNQDTTTVKNEYMPIWVKQIPLSSPDAKVSNITGNGIISTIQTNNANTITCTVNGSNPTTIQINTIYFPGWNVSVNNRPYPVLHNNSMGVMDVSLPAGNNAVRVHFSETPIRIFSDLISLLSITIVCFSVSPYKKLLKFTM